MQQAARHIIFSGRVQGVGFRFTVHRLANRYGLNGQVRNVPDGTVEMIAQGPIADIDNCISGIRGTFDNYVRDIKITEIPFEPKFTDFRITF